MLLFALILILLAVLAEYRLSAGTLSQVEDDLTPETNVAQPGQVLWLRVSLRSTGRRPISFLRVSLFLQEEIEPLDQKHCTYSSALKGSTFRRTTWLRPRQETQLRIPVRIARRGRYVLRPVSISAGDFLGLKEETRRSARFREVVVAPKEAPEPDITAILSGFLGEVSVRRFLYEDPVLTAGFREYTGQEPMKKISWTQSARGRGFMVKNDDHTAEPSVSVILNADLHESGQTQELEVCCSLTRTVCRILEERRVPHDLITNSVTAGGWYDDSARGLPRGFGSEHFGRVLELLGRITGTVYSRDEVFLKEIADSRVHCGRILITPASGMPQEAVLRRLREVSDGSLLVLTSDMVSGPGNGGST